jgi:hypothetical protein
VTGDDGRNRYSNAVEGAHADDRSRGDLVVALADSSWRPRRSAAGLRGASTATKINEGFMATRRKESRYRYAPPGLVDVAVFANIGAGSSLRREMGHPRGEWRAPIDAHRRPEHPINSGFLGITHRRSISLPLSAPGIQTYHTGHGSQHRRTRPLGTGTPDFDRNLSLPRTLTEVGPLTPAAKLQLICAGFNHEMRRKIMDSAPST